MNPTTAIPADKVVVSKDVRLAKRYTSPELRKKLMKIGEMAKFNFALAPVSFC